MERVQFINDQADPLRLSNEEIASATRHVKRDAAISHLEDIGFSSLGLADEIDELEGKCPSYLGGLVRGAMRLLLCVKESLMQQGQENDERDDDEICNE